MRILLIEDDKILGETLVDYLLIYEIETKWLCDERELPRIIKNFEFDVIVVDLILKFTSGEKIISTLRKAEIKTPILVITAKRGINDKETCFTEGADDYLTKPFSFEEFVLRLRALSKRRKIESVIKIGELIINLDAKTIKNGDSELLISKTAWQLLTLLVKRRGEIVDSETVLNYIRPDKDVGEEIVRAYIKELRKIFPPDTIKTYPGKGYKLL